METDLPIEHIKKKQPKRTQPIPSYDIATDILDRPTNATFRDLINDVPKYRRQLAGVCRTRRTATKNQDSQQTVAIIEDDEFNTTAVYSKTTIGDHRIRTLIDCGAAKTCTVGQKTDARNCKIPVSQLVVNGYCIKLSQTLIVCSSIGSVFIRRVSDIGNDYWWNLTLLKGVL
ncbi:hypothetical protein G6F42_026606 [Rhizopus arrhizus]|nr:hypothetical protein G6F42_026606 [Rhizopus arrhizus]